MNEELKRNVDSYISCHKKIDDLDAYINEKGTTLPVAKLQKSLDSMKSLGEEMLRCRDYIYSVVPNLNEEEFYELFETLGPYMK